MVRFCLLRMEPDETPSLSLFMVSEASEKLASANIDSSDVSGVSCKKGFSHSDS